MKLEKSPKGTFNLGAGLMNKSQKKIQMCKNKHTLISETFHFLTVCY